MTTVVDVTRSTPVSESARARQLEGMFDVPHRSTIEHRWSGRLDLDRPWQIGLIVGPSGAGKSTLLTELFGEPAEHEWSTASVVDDFDADLSMDQIAAVCQAVGFNTIPSWLKPYAVLSTGERFRVSLARTLIESSGLAVVDEFSSVVDRQVAQIGAHAVSKWVRSDPNRRFVAATCHYDVTEWLQPDWVLEPHTLSLSWGSVQLRPRISAEIFRTDHSTWKLFAPYHYLTAELSTAAACFVLCVDDRPASFAGVLHRPQSRRGSKQNIKGLSRSVTLPDWQGLGLAFVLSGRLGAAYKALGYRLRSYPSHPAFVRARDRSPEWALIKRPAMTSRSQQRTGSDARFDRAFGGRSNAVFEYCGEAMDDKAAAAALLDA